MPLDTKPTQPNRRLILPGLASALVAPLIPSLSLAKEPTDIYKSLFESIEYKDGSLEKRIEFAKQILDIIYGILPFGVGKPFARDKKEDYTTYHGKPQFPGFLKDLGTVYSFDGTKHIRSFATYEDNQMLLDFKYDEKGQFYSVSMTEKESSGYPNGPSFKFDMDGNIIECSFLRGNDNFGPWLDKFGLSVSDLERAGNDPTRNFFFIVKEPEKFPKLSFFLNGLLFKILPKG